MKRIVSVPVVLALLLAGCQGFTTSTNPAAVSTTLTAEVISTKTLEQQQLEETVWVLQSINGEPALPDVEVTLEFASDAYTLMGYTGCNHYGGPYKILEHDFAIIEIEMSAQDCPQENLMAQERRYEDILWNIASYSIEEGELMLTTDTGETLIFVP